MGNTVFIDSSCFSITKQRNDSLNKILPSLKDTARIDCMASIAEYFVRHSQREKKDSILYYTTLAYLESKEINYTHGIAEAFANKSSLKNNDYSFQQAEQLANESLKWFNLTSNKNKIAIAYRQLSKAQCGQGRGDEGLASIKLSYIWAKETGDTCFEGGLVSALEAMTNIYRERGEYDNLLAAQQELIASENADHEYRSGYTIHELWVMGLMNMLLKDYTTALFYWRKLFSGKDNVFLNTWNRCEYAQLLTLANEPDSALYYYNLFDSAKADISNLRLFLVSKGEYFLCLKQYETALPYFLKGLLYNRQLNERIEIKRSLLDIAKTYTALNKDDSAISYARKGLSMSIQAKAKPSILNAYEILYTAYDHLHQTDSANYYYRFFATTKETVMDEQTKGKIASHEYEHKIELMDKEHLIAKQDLKIQQQQLAESALQKKILASGIAAICVIGVFIFRVIILKRKHEKVRLENELHVQKLETQKQLSELEMLALRVQMNPHFIFNCLSSINRYILINNIESASSYLTKFSRLIRMVLQHSEKSMITLENELEMLRRYLDLERLRFKNAFDYCITFVNTIDTATIFVPPLILQPFAENAIWHGLMHKKGVGHLDIALKVEAKVLTIVITDNGIGRSEAAVLKSKDAEKDKSRGMKITIERLALLNKAIDQKSFFDIEDVKDEEGNTSGTKVELKIHYKDTFETIDQKI